MRMCGDKVQLTTYVDLELYNKIENERKKTRESQSGIIYSVLEAVFNELIPADV
jgi:hypothetical protein